MVMSNYTRIVIDIHNIDTGVLEKALEKLSGKLGGVLKKNTVVTYYGGSKHVDYLIEMNLPYGNGIGVDIDGNKIEVHVDLHGTSFSSGEIENMIKQEYVCQMLLNTLSSKYSLSVSEQGDKIYIYAYELGG